MWSFVAGLDIETDTTPLPGMSDVPRGLDPAVSSVVAVAVSAEEVSYVFDRDSHGDEAAILMALDDFLGSHRPGVLVTWNGSSFDLPFVAARARALGVPLGLRLEADPGLSPKYPNAALPGACVASWASSSAVPHGHLDIAYAFKGVALAHEVPWSLKPVATLFGMSPVEVDRERIHSLSAEELLAYVLSDAYCTRMLAGRLLSGDLSPVHLPGELEA